MSAYAASSLCLGLCLVNAGAAMTGPSGFTELYDQAPATNTRVHVSYDMSSPTTSLAWAGSNSESIAYGIEVAEPAGGDQEITGSLFTDPDTTTTGVVTTSYEILGALFEDPDSTTTGQLDLEIIGSLFTDPDTLYSGTLTAEYEITGSLFSDPDDFYSGVVQLESDQNIAGSLFVDPDSTFSGAITTDYTITGSLFADPDTFHSGAVGLEITGSHFADPDVFYTGTLEGGEVGGTPVGVLSFTLLRKRRKAGD